ncbi:hypothetical protein F5148DRAFT_1155201, partial [Russula earlei]
MGYNWSLEDLARFRLTVAIRSHHEPSNDTHPIPSTAVRQVSTSRATSQKADPFKSAKPQSTEIRSLMGDEAPKRLFAAGSAMSVFEGSKSPGLGLSGARAINISEAAWLAIMSSDWCGSRGLAPCSQGSHDFIPPHSKTRNKPPSDALTASTPTTCAQNVAPSSAAARTAACPPESEVTCGDSTEEHEDASDHVGCGRKRPALDRPFVGCLREESQGNVSRASGASSDPNSKIYEIGGQGKRTRVDARELSGVTGLGLGLESRVGVGGEHSDKWGKTKLTMPPEQVGYFCTTSLIDKRAVGLSCNRPSETLSRRTFPHTGWWSVVGGDTPQRTART